jgi:aspartyl-tRNA(Asn)/glutamyl-tRNA(Gln) amidotransferase subunit A
MMSHDPYHAFIALTGEAPNQNLGSLAGLKIGIKGNIAVKGLANTAGSGARRHAIALEDAPVVSQLRAAGATIVGTLNMHEGALGATTDNKAYGRCINPWRDGFSPGGSSGGSGAAIAAGLVDGALGSDTLGSIRLPASYCGVFGYKPAGEIVSQVGVVPLSTTLDQVGPLAKDAPTLWAMAQALGCPPPLRDLSGLTFGVVRDMVPAAPQIAALFEKSSGKLRASGATLVDIKLGLGADGALGLSDVDVILAALLVCEVEGAREWAAELADPKSDISDEFRAMLNYGANIGSAQIEDAYNKLAKVKTHLRGLMADQGLVGIVSPTVSHLAFDHDVGPPMDQAFFTQYANIADLPALSAPMGLITGLPAGIMCMAAPKRDDVVLGFAGLFDPLSLPLVV